MSTLLMVSSLLGAMAALCAGAAVTIGAMVQSEACIAFWEDCSQQTLLRSHQAPPASRRD